MAHSSRGMIVKKSVAVCKTQNAKTPQLCVIIAQIYTAENYPEIYISQKGLKQVT